MGAAASAVGDLASGILGVLSLADWSNDAVADGNAIREHGRFSITTAPAPAPAPGPPPPADPPPEPAAFGDPRTTSSTPPPDPATPPPAPRTYPEQQASRGANTFLNPHNASGMGPRINPNQWVDVSYKLYDPYIQSVNPDGYWYRIASAPWNNKYYAAANTFWDGDTPSTPQSQWHNTDFNVPDC